MIGASLCSWITYEFDNYEIDTSLRNKLFKRSQCDHCGEKLKWYNLFPVFSYLLQKGKSTCCNKQINFKYLALESFAGVILLLSFSLNSIYLGIIALLVLALVIFDERYLEIPLWINIAMLVWVLNYHQNNSSFEMIQNNFVFALIVFAALLLLYFIFLKVKGYAGFGLGDAILIFSICLHLGLPLGIYAITLASLGLLVKILWVKRYKEQHAFGSWLGGSFLVITLYQEFYGFEGLASI